MAMTVDTTPPPVAQLLEQLEGPLEQPLRFERQRGDGEGDHDLVQRLPRRRPSHERELLPRPDLVDEPCPQLPQLDDAKLPHGGRQVRFVAELLGEGDGPAVGLLGSTGVAVRRRGEPLAHAQLEEGLPELQTRRELSPSVPALGGDLAGPPGQVGR